MQAPRLGWFGTLRPRDLQVRRIFVCALPSACRNCKCGCNSYHTSLSPPMQHNLCFSNALQFSYPLVTEDLWSTVLLCQGSKAWVRGMRNNLEVYELKTCSMKTLAITRPHLPYPHCSYWRHNYAANGLASCLARPPAWGGVAVGPYLAQSSPGQRAAALQE